MDDQNPGTEPVDPTIRVEDLPVSLLQIELSQPLVELSAYAVDGVTGKKMRALIRLHHQPLGYVVLEAPVASVGTIAAEIERQLGSEVAQHIANPPAAPAGLTEWPFISIVVPTHNRPTQVESLINTLAGLDYGNYEVVVVENGATDGRTEAVVTNFGDDRFRFAYESVGGVSSGRNRGISEARGDIVAFIDDDVVVDAWYLQAVATGFSRAENVGCVTGLVAPMYLNNAAELYIDQRLDWADNLKPRLFDLVDNRDDSVLYPFSAGVFGTGANFAVRKSVFAKIGNFDEALGGVPTLGGEDLDIFLRVVLGGYTLVREPGAIVHHAHYDNFEILHRQMFNYGRGFTAYLTKHLLRPKTGIQILSKIPLGAARILKAKEGAEDLGIAPPELVGREFRGMLSGPLAYVRSAIALRRTRRSRSDVAA